jgi:two-component system, OmpR family, KDP operon response regulator KdpE
MAANVVRVLIVDDELAIRRLLRTSLAVQDYKVIEAEDGRTALERLKREKPDLMVLDLSLPDMDGRDVIRRVRDGSKIPIVILSSRGDERSKVEAFELGADDYVTKPFGTDELLARLRTALRHGFQEQGQEPVFQDGDLVVDLVRRHVIVGGNEIKLSPKEYDVLRLLVVHSGKVLTHHQILSEVWGNARDVQYLRVYVRQLRRKLEADPEQPRHIVTEPGVGYRLQLLD